MRKIPRGPTRTSGAPSAVTIAISMRGSLSCMHCSSVNRPTPQHQLSPPSRAIPARPLLFPGPPPTPLVYPRALRKCWQWKRAGVAMLRENAQRRRPVTERRIWLESTSWPGQGANCAALGFRVQRRDRLQGARQRKVGRQRAGAAEAFICS